MDTLTQHTILIVDDHPIMREGLATVIAAEPDLRVCAQAGSEPEALALAAQHQPEVVILDLSLTETSGITLLNKLRRQLPAARLLVFSMHDEHMHAEKCLQAGAHGYLMKNQPAEVLIGAIRTLLGGDLFVSKHMRTLMLQGLTQGQTAKASPSSEHSPALLTRTEWLVLELIGMGFSSRSIAEKLKRSIKTISAHRANIQRKLGLPDNAALMRYAIQWSQQAPTSARPMEMA